MACAAITNRRAKLIIRNAPVAVAKPLAAAARHFVIQSTRGDAKRARAGTSETLQLIMVSCFLRQSYGISRPSIQVARAGPCTAGFMAPADVHGYDISKEAAPATNHRASITRELRMGLWRGLRL